ncbi:multidrug efflux RND transporter permease subunit [Phenylobacterium sp. LjRoot219]|uniref:efflux RND transporter permease subunit n=1 Tax=Phenylobacterium sp. LjRoot219 TaxID=3342283 RepID=UPI003ECDCC5D
MSLPRFFIDRPVFAAVLSIVITLAGLMAVGRLPISEYPNVVPPTISITASYPGASPETLAETVAAPIEQAVNGVEGLMYVTSQATTDGQLTINVNFKLGTDLDKAQVLVQNRVATAEPRLPEEVRRLGVVVDKSSPTFLMVVHLLSPDGRYDPLYISNYASLKVRDQLARNSGVADARLFGARDYSMRIWLDPEKIAALNLSPSDILAGLRRQSIQVAAGSLGAEPQPNGAAFQMTVEAPGRLIDPEQFAEVVVARGPDGALVRVRDIGRVELGAQTYQIDASLDGKQAVAIGIFQRPGSNALQTADEIKAEMARLSKDFPDGLKYEIVYDTTRFVNSSIEKVEHTLFEAVILVVLVVFLFLQSWRAAIIPVLAIPVSILGSFAFLSVTGGSINTLSLFGLILAIGIVVDDAIVVVENVERNIARGLSPKEAARVSMDEVGGALIAIALVLTAVFLPTAFMGGVAGEFFRQFALTIASATLISCFVSLTLSPALCAILLKPHTGHGHGPLARFFGAFNKGFDWLSERYGQLTARSVRMLAIVGILYGGLLLLTGGAFMATPKGFIPQMDRGYGIVLAQLPEGASLQRTRAVVQDAVKRIHTVDGVTHDVSFIGFSAATGAQATNIATIFVPYADAEERARNGRTEAAIQADIRKALAPIQDSITVVVSPPMIMGLGSSAGAKMFIEDQDGKGYAALEAATQAVAGEMMKDPHIAFAFSPYEARTPRLKVDVDRDKAEAAGTPVSEINDALQVYLGSAYVNDFNYLGRTYRVTAQADGEFRRTPEDLNRLWARNLDGQMTPLASVITAHDATGPGRVPRHNLYPAADLSAAAAPGSSSGQLMEAMEKAAIKALPPGFGFEWTELAYLQKTEASGAIAVFALATLFVFLVLAAQYESVTLPISVLLVVPMSVLGALAGLLIRGLEINILTQVALVVLVGLAAKNAILIVEFAKQLEDQEGLDPRTAAIQSAKLRLRPILMTSLAFILGVMPLAFSTGAGFEQRVAIGTAVFAGMIGVTILGLILTPAFYVMTRELTRRLPPVRLPWRRRAAPAE